MSYRRSDFYSSERGRRNGRNIDKNRYSLLEYQPPSSGKGKVIQASSIISGEVSWPFPRKLYTASALMHGIPGLSKNLSS